MWKDPLFRERRLKEVSQNIDKYRNLATKARQMRKSTSNLHLTFKKQLIKNGIYNFETEQPYGFYSIDELDLNKKLVLEIDGCYWHGCVQCGYPGVPNIIATDHRKDAYLKNRKFKILRIKEHDIKADLQSCIEEVKKFINY